MADFDRFRSFAERYVIERASSFRTGFEQDDAWTAILDAKAVYHQIGEQAKYMDKPAQAETAQGAGQQAIPNYPQPPQQVRVVLPSTAPVVQQPALGLRSYVRNILKGGQA